MDYNEFKELLTSRIYKLPFKKQLELALTICKRLFFGYQNFSEVERWGDSNLLMDAIRICEKYLDKPTDIPLLKGLLLKIDLIIPDTDDFANINVSYALNASVSVYETLQYLIDKKSIHIINIASYYSDTIDFKIYENHDGTMIDSNSHPSIFQARNFLMEMTK